MTKDYDGDTIGFTEWPVGCEVFCKDTGVYIMIRSQKDAEALVESLTRYIEVLEENNNG